METVVIVVHLIFVFALLALVLLQTPESGGAGLTSGSFRSARSSSRTLVRLTSACAVAFFTTSLLLGILGGITKKKSSTILEQTVVDEENSAKSSVLDKLKKMQDDLKDRE